MCSLEVTPIKRHHHSIPKMLFFGSVFHAFSSRIQISGVISVNTEIWHAGHGIYKC